MEKLSLLKRKEKLRKLREKLLDKRRRKKWL
jgi:hypothetical protein